MFANYDNIFLIVQMLMLFSFRLKAGKKLRDKDAIKEVKKNIHLIKSPAGKGCSIKNPRAGRTPPKT